MEMTYHVAFELNFGVSGLKDLKKHWYNKGSMEDFKGSLKILIVV